MGSRQLNRSWQAPLSEAIKFTCTVVVYNFIKDLPPDFDNQFVESIGAIVTILLSTGLTVGLFHFLVGLPRVEVLWTIGVEPPASNRPELPTGKTGVTFRYRFECDTVLARWLMKLTHSYKMQAEIKFSPSANIAVTDQFCGPETTVTNSCVTTRFEEGMEAGNGADGQISVRRNQRRNISTPVDCSLSIRPMAGFEGKKRAKWLSKLIVTDATVDGFVLKGGS